MEPKQYSTEEILEMLKKANSKSLLKFISDRVQEDESLRQALGLFLDQPSTKEFNAKDFEDKILKAWKRALEDSIGQQRYSSFWEQELEGKLQKILKRLRKESPNLELRISLQIKLLENFRMRSSYKWDILSSILKDFIQDFRSILEDSKEAEGHLIIRKYLFNACLNHLRKFRVLSNDLEYRRELESFVLETFTEEFSDQIKDYFNKRIQSVQSSEADYLDKDYWIEGYVEKILSLLSRNNTSETELLDYAYDYWKFENVRLWFISYYKESTQWDKAIKVIEEDLLNRGILPSQSYYSRKELKELYLLNDDKEKYRQILLEEIKEFKGEIVTEMDMYRELKSLYTPDEWTKVREQIFASKVTNYEILVQYFLEDNLLQRLAKLLLADDTSYAFFDKYVLHLPTEYREQILEKYQKYFASLMLKAKDRIRYKELMNTLKDAHKIEGGKELTQRLTTQWLKKYEARPSLCEEIRNFQSECKSMD